MMLMLLSQVHKGDGGLEKKITAEASVETAFAVTWQVAIFDPMEAWRGEKGG